MGCDIVHLEVLPISLRISIHAPIVGCDSFAFIPADRITEFQSTHPSWGATAGRIFEVVTCTISIHAPIVGCDNES